MDSKKQKEAAAAAAQAAAAASAAPGTFVKKATAGRWWENYLLCTIACPACNGAALCLLMNLGFIAVGQPDCGFKQTFKVSEADS